MNYPDGKKVMVGDQVKLWEGCHGTVVASMDDGEYTPQYSKADWSYLKNGVLISSDKAGLVHYLRPESSFELVQRSPGKTKAQYKSMAHLLDNARKYLDRYLWRRVTGVGPVIQRVA